MGHKVHPIGFRLGVVKGWQSRWFAERDYKETLAEDFKLRKLIQKELANASVSRTEIERAAANQVSITIYTARPGIVIGKSGEKVDKLRATLEKETKKRVRLNIMEIRQPELDAYLVARSIAEQLEKRIAFRRAMKQAVQKTMRANAKGIRVVIGGRLGGAEIARSEKEVEGKIPLHTLRADIDYGLAEAHTTFGVIGIKVWIYKGDILPSKRRETLEGAQEGAAFMPSERAEGERRPPRAPRGDRSPRGERGERGERGDRPARPQGERTSRAQGERPARAQGTQGERAQRPPRQQGERPARPPRAARPAQSERQEPREQQGQPVRPARQPAQPAVEQTEQAPVVETNEQGQAGQAVETTPTQTPETGAPESE